MDRTRLEQLLAQGLSLEEIGRRVGRDASTVGYWVRKHRLEANGRAKYAPRGGIERARLAGLVGAGLTLREIADDCSVSVSTVCHWLKAYGLRTQRGRRKVVIADDGQAVGECRRHGRTEFARFGQQPQFRCRRCVAERVAARRRRLKEILVEEAGGRCRLCGYERYVGALHFHHTDPAAKEFGLGARGITRSLERVRAEAAKCVLLCSNCHAEVEGGVVRLELS